MIRRRTAIVSCLLAAGIALSACGSHPQAFGGNNAPRSSTSTVPATKTGPSAGSSTTTAPTTTTTTPSSTTTSTTVPPTTTTLDLPPGEHSAFGTPQKGRPWTVPGTPEWVAAQYVAGDHYLSWRSPVVAGTGLGYWATLIRPYSTPAWWKLVTLGVTRQETTGTAIPSDVTYWDSVVRRQETKTARIVEANRVDQAGWTATHMYVEVQWYYDRVTRAHPSQQPGIEPDFTTDYCTMVKVGGHWLVSHEINALDMQ